MQMNHAQIAVLSLHLPRSRPGPQAHSLELEEYILLRVNERLKPETPFTSIQQLRYLDIVVGEILFSL